MRKKIPEPIGTVWTMYAKIQRINESTNKWETLDTCIDTPRHVRECIARLRKQKKNAGVIYWVASYVEGHLLGRKYYG